MTMNEKPQEPVRDIENAKKYRYKDRVDYWPEIWPDYYIDMIAWQEERIEQLEKALKSCKTVLQLEQHQRDKFINASNAAIVEAEKALALMVP
jgi:hypothetical protein